MSTKARPKAPKARYSRSLRCQPAYRWRPAPAALDWSNPDMCGQSPGKAGRWLCTGQYPVDKPAACGAGRFADVRKCSLTSGSLVCAAALNLDPVDHIGTDRVCIMLNKSHICRAIAVFRQCFQCVRVNLVTTVNIARASAAAAPFIH